MTGEGPYILFYVLAIVLVASSLIGMRIAPGKLLKMVLAWVAIFAVAFVLFSFRNELSNLGERLRAEATGEPIRAGESVRIPISDDGHYWVTAELNGRDVPFMIDSGASITTVSRDEAQAAGIADEGRRVPVSTANGTVLVTMARADALNVAGIERQDMLIHITDADDVNLLGMNFLSSLEGWRVEGNYLVLQP